MSKLQFGFSLTPRLVSSYSIASDGREYIRVGAVDLQSGSEGIYQIQPCREKWEEPIVSFTVSC